MSFLSCLPVAAAAAAVSLWALWSSYSCCFFSFCFVSKILKKYIKDMLETSESDIHGKNDSGLGQGGRRGLRLEEGHWCGWGVLGWVGGW